MKFISLIIIFLSIMNVSFANENLVCQSVESKGEGHWPIPEEAFTKENSLKEINKLKAMLNTKAIYIEDMESIKHNAFVIFEGYILKKRIIELQAENSDSVAMAKREFCNFLKIKAYTSH